MLLAALNRENLWMSIRWIQLHIVAQRCIGVIPRASAITDRGSPTAIAIT
ncbi:MAG: hypothetical protein WDO18_20430 [Acidobacteriota bacterium]